MAPPTMASVDEGAGASPVAKGKRRASMTRTVLDTLEAEGEETKMPFN